MLRTPPGSTRTDTLCPNTTLFRASANYSEHYGLLRQKMADGRYERAQPRHSWNSNHIASNLILFHLQRHSDHHAHPTRSYQSLRDFKGLPELPTGYPGMFFMAMIPPIFRRSEEHTSELQSLMRITYA